MTPAHTIMAADLFSYRYPKTPGWTEPTTSRDSALLMVNTCDQFREIVLRAIAASPSGLTADEAAAKIGRTVLATRPRVAELRGLGKIEDTGERRRNESGRLAKTWRVRPCAPK